MTGHALDVLLGTGLVVLTLGTVQWLLLQALYFMRSSGGRFPPAPQSGQEWPPISVLIAAFNEERVIEAAVRSLLAADYGAAEIIVIDDCSQDRTAQIVARLAVEDSRMSLLSLPQNQGKAAALNAGVAAATAEYLVVTDADTIASADFLKWMIAPLVNGQADAVAGKVKAGYPGGSGVMQTLQSIEYVTVQHLTRVMQKVSNSAIMVPGNAGAFRKAAVLAVGGYSPRAKAEDADLSFRLVKHGLRIVCQPRATVWTEVPTTWPSFFRQRLRWIHGNLQCIFRDPGGQFGAGRSFYAFALYAYENLWRPPLEFARACLPVLVLAGVLPAAWIFGYAGLLMLNGLVVAIAYGTEEESLREVRYFPLQYAIWAMFLIVPYCVAAWHCVFRYRTPWGKAQRSGVLASMAMRGKLAAKSPDQSVR